MNNERSLKIKCTCGACPEQYSVYNNRDEIVGYIHLRYGDLFCSVPDVGGTIVYRVKDIKGPYNNSRFENDEERKIYLNNCMRAIYQYYNDTNKDIVNAFKE